MWICVRACVCVPACVCVFECVWECVHSWGRVKGVLGPPFERGLTVQDWTMFIYNRAEENRFVPDDIFIDWNMYCPPSCWKWLISGLVVAVLFLGGQGAMSTQHVEFEMDSLFYPDMDFSILPPTDLKRKGGKKWNISPVWRSFHDKWDVTEKQRGFRASLRNFKCHRKKKDDSISWFSLYSNVQHFINI